MNKPKCSHTLKCYVMILTNYQLETKWMNLSNIVLHEIKSPQITFEEKTLFMKFKIKGILFRNIGDAITKKARK